MYITACLSLFFLFSFFSDNNSLLSDETILLNSYPLTGEFIDSDVYGNLYITSRNRLSRYNLKGKSSGKYDWGHNITSVDNVDPSRILLFSKQDKVVCYLDGTLNEFSDDIFLDKYAINEPLLACADQFGGFWIYDGQSEQISYIDNGGNLSVNSGAVSSYYNGVFSPKKMINANGKIYLSDPFRGIMVFDNNANFIKTLPIFNASSFYVSSKGEICFVSQNMLLVFDSEKPFDEKKIEIPNDNIMGYAVSLDAEPPRIFIMTDRAIKVYGL